MGRGALAAIGGGLNARGALWKPQELNPTAPASHKVVVTVLDGRKLAWGTRKPERG